MVAQLVFSICPIKDKWCKKEDTEIAFSQLVVKLAMVFWFR